MTNFESKGTSSEDLVKDLSLMTENHEQLDPYKEQRDRIDQKVEELFQEFMNSEEYNPNSSAAEKQEQFNNWMETKVCTYLDEELDTNELALYSDICSILNELQFQINEIVPEKPILDWSEFVSLEKKVSSETISKLVEKINSNNFDKKDDIIKCLKWINENFLNLPEKKKLKENIRMLQYILIGEEYRESITKDWGLNWYWTDWSLWTETFNLLDKYVDEAIAAYNSAATESNQHNQDIVNPDQEQYGQEVSEEVLKQYLLGTSLTEEQAEALVSYCDSGTMNFPNLESISLPLAKILKDFKWEYMQFSALKQLDTDVLKELIKGGYTISFNNWSVEKTNDSYVVTIKEDDGNKTYTEIDQTVCNLLIGVDWKMVIDANNDATVDANNDTTVDVNNGNILNDIVVTASRIDNTDLYVYDLTVEQVKEILEKHSTEETINFPNLRELNLDVATELTKFSWTYLQLPALEAISVDVLEELMKGKYNISFENWIVENGQIKIKNDDGTYEEYEGSILQELCNYLVKKKEKTQPVQVPVQPLDNAWAWDWDQDQPNVERTGGQGAQINNNPVSTDVRYQPSATMKPEAYERMSIDDEKKAIRALLGTEWLFWGLIWGWRGTEQNSHAKKEYRVRWLSEEWENIHDLREILEYYADLENQVYTLSDCFYVFNTLYTKWKKFSYNDLKLLERKGEDWRYLNQWWRWLFTQLFEKFGWLFTQYKEWKGGRYFRSTMELLEDYFYRWRVSLEDIQSGKAFAKIYEENNLWVAKWWLDADNLDVQFDDGEWSNDRLWYNEKWEKEFVSLLSDFNLDWRIDNDDSSYYMWLELWNVYKSVNVDLRNDNLSDEVESDQYVWKNIVDFAISYFDAMWDENMVAKLKSANTVDELNAVLKEKEGWKYGTLQSLQSMIKDSPVPPSFIFKYWNRAAEMFFNELMSSKDFDEMYDKWFEKLVQQWLDPSMKEKVKPIAYASYINWWAWVWLWVARDAGKIWTFDMSLWATNIGWDGGAVYWIMFWWRTKDLSVWTWKVNTWLNVWNTGSVDAPLVVLWNVNTVSWVINEKKLKEIKPVPVKRFTMGLSAWWLGDGLYASLKSWVSRDYIEWANRMHNELNNYLRNWLKEAFDSEEFKTFFTNWKFDTTKSDEIKAFLRKKLEDGKTDKAVVDAAVDNVYNGLIYFSAWLTFNEKDEESFNVAKNLMIHQLAETYTNIYVSDYIDKNLDTGLWKCTQAGLWLAVFLSANIYESIGKSIYYSATWNLGFTKYWNAYSEETDQSRASYEARLATWVWFDFLESSVDPDTWMITQEAITYLNNKLGIVKNPNMPKLEIKDGVLYIPRRLVRWANIYIDPSLNGSNVNNFVKSDDDWFMVPLNTEIALLTNSKTSTTQFDLVIWNYKKVDDAILLNDRSNFEWDPLNYEWKENANWKTFVLDKVNSEMKDLYDREDFPLSTCEKTADWKLVFVLKDWKKISVEDSTLLDSKWNIIVSNYWRLLITKDNNWEYKASFEKWDKEQLMVVYDDWSKISVPLMWEGWVDMWEVYGDGYNALRQNFEKFEKALSKIDDEKWSQYVAFMNETCDLDGDIVNMDDYRKAFEKVKKMLDSSSDSSLADIRALVDAITLDEQKVFVVDKFKMIFSLERRTNTVSGLRALAWERGKVYENLPWYITKREDFPLKNLDYRTKLINKLWNGRVERVYDESLVWMTAFYRRWYDGITTDQHTRKLLSTQLKEGLWYSMTDIWSTDYLWELLPITDNLEGDKGVKEWFINNLKKTDVHKNILKKFIKERVKSEIADDQLYDLLRWKEVSIDNWAKKVKIEVNYVFYLLWECANESIWTKLWNIEISWWGGWDWDWNGNRNEVIIDAEASYEWVAWVYSWNVEAANRTVIQPVASFGAAAAVWPTKDEPIPDVWEWAITHQEATVRPWHGSWWSMTGQWWYIWWWHWTGWSGSWNWWGWGH